MFFVLHSSHRRLSTIAKNYSTTMSEVNKKFTVNNLFNVEGWVAVVSGGGTGSVNTHSDNLHYNTVVCVELA